MLSAMLIGPEDSLVRDCKDKLRRVTGLYLCHQTPHYPAPAELVGILDQFNPDAVIVNVADYTQVCRSIGRLSIERPQLQIVALSATCDQGLLLDLMQLGVRELWFAPLEAAQMQAAVDRLLALKTASQSDGSGSALIAFLPARGGCGASTVALNTAAAIQRLGSKVLLADFDFHNSVLAFWLKLAPRHGLQEALERAHSLDPALWKSMVHPYEGLDILTSPQGTSPAAFSGAETDALLHFAARHYEFVLVDLPEALYTSCWGMIERAKLVLLVTTPEMASLYLARRKASDLVNHGISRERLRVVLNRCSKIDVSADEVEKFLTIPVLASLSNQYRAVTGAFAGGRHVPESSKLGEEIAVLANAIAGALPRTKEKPSPIKMLRRILSPA